MLLLKYWGNPYPQSYTTIKIVVSRYVQKHLQKNLLPDTENPRSLVKSMPTKTWSMACGSSPDKIMSSGGKALFDVNPHCACWVPNTKRIVDFKCAEPFIFFLTSNALNTK